MVTTEFYVDEGGTRFRLHDDRRQARWNPGTTMWISVNEYVIYKAYIDADPYFEQTDRRHFTRPCHLMPPALPHARRWRRLPLNRGWGF